MDDVQYHSFSCVLLYLFESGRLDVWIEIPKREKSGIRVKQKSVDSRQSNELKLFEKFDNRFNFVFVGKNVLLHFFFSSRKKMTSELTNNSLYRLDGP